MPRTILLLLAGNLAASTAIIFIKLSTIHPLYQAAFRVAGAALVMAPFYLVDLRRHRLKPGWELLRPSLGPGLVLALHFATWLVAAKLTLAANATIIVNMMPVGMPFIAYALHGERINRREALGTLLTVAGLAVLGWHDLRLDSTTFLGDVLSFVSMLFYALYLALAKKYNNLPSTTLYVVPLYLVAGSACLAFALPLAPLADQPYSPANLALLAGLVLVPTVLGHSIFNHAMRSARSQVLSLFMFAQIFFSAVLAAVLLAEIPAPAFYPAAALMAAGMVVCVVPAGKS